MRILLLQRFPLLATCCLAVTLWAPHASADGAIGEHVNDLQGHLDEYSQEVTWLIDQVRGIVDRYEKNGVAAAQPESVVDHWEAVKFHSAIETNYIPLYASIWQGLFGVRTAIEEKKPVQEVRAQLTTLEQTLWQSLGAVKVAAQYQQRGMLPAVEHTQAGSPAETLDIVKRNIDRSVAKYAERLPEEAVAIVQETYLTLFEGVEGALIEQDAVLVEDLEVDFNVRLPKALQEGKPLETVKAVVNSMQLKLDRARSLLVEAEKDRKDVF